MKGLLVLLVLAAAGYFVYSKLRATEAGQAVAETAQKAQEGNTAPAKAVQGMVNSVERAEDVKDRANAVMEERSQAVQAPPGE